MSALTDGYRDSLEAKWWTSWEIFRRLLLISVVVSLPGRSVSGLSWVKNFIIVFLGKLQRLICNFLESSKAFNKMLLNYFDFNIYLGHKIDWIISFTRLV